MSQRFVLSAAAISAAVVLLSFSAAAGAGEEHHGTEVHVQGEVLDLACWVAHEAKGPEHAGCATKCLAAGQPMGLLAADGTVYVLFADHSDASAYSTAKGLGGKKVELEGQSAERGGIRGITVQAVRPL